MIFNGGPVRLHATVRGYQTRREVFTLAMTFRKFICASSLKGRSGVGPKCKGSNKTFMLLKSHMVQWAKKKVSIPGHSGTH